MAWKPTQKQISAYEDILRKYQKMRRQIIKAHRHLEDITPSGRMPSLVVPQRERKMSMRQIQISGRRIFGMKIRQLKKMVGGGMSEFFSNYKKTYLQLYRDYIIGESPEGYQNRYYSEEQIEDARKFGGEKYGTFLRDYNRIVGMNGAVFTFLLKSGKLKEFKYLYQEFSNDGLNVYENFANEFHKGLRWARRINPKEAVRLLTETNWSKSSLRLMKEFVADYESRPSTVFEREHQRLTGKR